jgi:hypothetical protein
MGASDGNLGFVRRHDRGLARGDADASELAAMGLDFEPTDEERHAVYLSRTTD